MHEFGEAFLYVLGGAGGGFLGGYYLRDLAISSTLKLMEKELRERETYDNTLHKRLKLYLEDMDKIIGSRFMIFSKKSAKHVKNTIEEVISTHYPLD